MIVIDVKSKRYINQIKKYFGAFRLGSDSFIFSSGKFSVVTSVDDIEIYNGECNVFIAQSLGEGFIEVLDP